MPGIKITGVRATPVNIPLEKPMWWTGGHHSGTSKTIIEDERDQGLAGLGEAPSIDVVPTLRAMGERLIGADPLDIALAKASAYRLGKSCRTQMTVRCQSLRNN